MASKHEIIKWSVISDWSKEGKGRLYCMNQGMATPLHGDQPIWFGPLKRKFKGFSDTFGFTFDYKDDWIVGTSRIPVFTAIEIKTKNDTVKKAQKDFLSFVKSIGGQAYIAWETDNDKGYFLQEWTG